MKIIITGGTGYIGSHLVRMFVGLGHEVCVMDWVKREHTLKNVRYYWEADYGGSYGLDMFRMYNPDYVFHCAGESLVGPSINNPGLYYDQNVGKLIKMMEVLRELRNRPKIIFSSSAAVYGKQTGRSEDDPINPYGRSKKVAELILEDYSAAYGMPTMIFRYFNAAGAGDGQNQDLGEEEGATHIIARALEAQIHGRTFTLYGNDYDTADGTCERDYVHVWDIARAYDLGVKYLDEYNRGYFTIDLGSGRTYSNLEVLEAIKKNVGPLDMKLGPRRPGDPDRLKASIRGAEMIIGWKPEHSSIDEIVKSAHSWYMKGRK